MRQVIKIVPKRALYRDNWHCAKRTPSRAALSTRHAGARSVRRPPRLCAAVTGPNTSGNFETYQRLAKIDEQGCPTASGLGDLALFGRLSEAARIFTQGAATDLASRTPTEPQKQVRRARHTQLLRQQPGAGIAAADKALASSNAVKIRFLAARVFVGRRAQAAQTLSDGLACRGSKPSLRPTRKVIEGEAALKSGDSRRAIEL